MNALQQLFDNAHLLLPFLIAFNLLLMGLHSALEKIKGLTKSKLDDDAYVLVHKVLTVLQKIIDLIAGNRAHP